MAGSVSIYEITGYTTSGALSSTGSSSSGSTTSASHPSHRLGLVHSRRTPEAASAHHVYRWRQGFTLSGPCNSVGGCSEYNAGGGGSANTVPITLSGSTPWVEAAMSFSTPFNPQSGIQVGGYPTMGVPSGASLVWEVTFTNVDPQHRTVTIWPQTELAIGSAEFDGFDTDYTQAHYYIIDSLNAGSTTVNAYTSTTGQYITLAYDVPTTLYFAATAALGSTTQAFGTNVLTPFEAYFALTGTIQRWEPLRGDHPLSVRHNHSGERVHDADRRLDRQHRDRQLHLAVLLRRQHQGDSWVDKLGRAAHPAGYLHDHCRREHPSRE